MDHQHGEHDAMQTGNPPAYDDLYGPQNSVPTSITRTINVGGSVHEDMTRWNREHSLLIFVASNGQPAGTTPIDSNSASVIVLLIQDSNAVPVAFSGQVSLEDFLSIRGAQVVGNFTLRLNNKSSTASTIADHLSTTLSNERHSGAVHGHHNDMVLDMDQAKILISQVELLQSQGHEDLMASQTTVALSTVLSSQVNLLQRTGKHVLWRWYKPESVYSCVAGKWETDIHSCVKDAQWNAGSGFHLLVKGVDAAELEESTAQQESTSNESIPCHIHDYAAQVGDLENYSGMANAFCEISQSNMQYLLDIAVVSGSSGKKIQTAELKKLYDRYSLF